MGHELVTAYSDRTARVLNYYREIDGYKPEEGQDGLSGVLILFSPSIVYKRGSREEIIGIDSLEEFIRNERNLRGKHIIEQIDEGRVNVTVTGTFKGYTESSGQRKVVHEPFDDFFVFEPSTNLVIYRLSTFSTGVQL